jgi:Tol biopolymer transport system component
MKVQRRKLLLISGTIVIVAILSVYFALRNDSNVELLVAWGSEGPEHTCFLEIVNPQTQASYHLTPDVEQCSFRTVTIDGKKKLFQTQSNPAQITVFSVTDRGSIEVEQTLNIDNNINLLSIVPIWNSQGNIYFTGRLANHQQIFQMNVETKQVVPFLTSINADATGIYSIAPDGLMIAFVRYEGFENTSQCQLGCYPYLSLYDEDWESGLLYLTIIDDNGSEVIEVEVQNGSLLDAGFAWLSP